MIIDVKMTRLRVRFQLMEYLYMQSASAAMLLKALSQSLNHSDSLSGVGGVRERVVCRQLN